MRLADEGKVIIEVGLNETYFKDVNPNIPYGPDEVGPAAIEAARAGASIIHFHSRLADGTGDWENKDIYMEAVEAINREVDVLTYPSFQPSGPACMGLELAPIDNGSVNLVGWDEDAGDFKQLGVKPDLQVVLNDPVALSTMYENALAWNLQPSVAAFELGWLRTALLAARAGRLREPLLLKFVVSEQWVHGPSPTPAGIDAYLSQIPDGVDLEGIVLPYSMNHRESVERLLRHGLDRGMNLRVGIGDNPFAFRTETNADLVRWAVGIAAEYGREPATADDVRRRFAMKPVARL